MSGAAGGGGAGVDEGSREDTQEDALDPEYDDGENYDEDEDEDPQYLARRSKRFFNALIDGAVWHLFCYLIMAQPGQDYASWLTQYGSDPVPGMVGLLIYYIAFEGVFQKTPAKWITRTRVVSARGGKPDLGRIIIRSLVRFVPFDAWTYVSGSGRGWHDAKSETCVVEED